MLPCEPAIVRDMGAITGGEVHTCVSQHSLREMGRELTFERVCVHMCGEGAGVEELCRVKSANFMTSYMHL